MRQASRFSPFFQAKKHNKIPRLVRFGENALTFHCRRRREESLTGSNFIQRLVTSSPTMKIEKPGHTNAPGLRCFFILTELNGDSGRFTLFTGATGIATLHLQE